jgi:hypothetical protein
MSLGLQILLGLVIVLGVLAGHALICGCVRQFRSERPRRWKRRA